MIPMNEKQRANLERYIAMRSVGDRVLIRPMNDLRGEEETTAGGIIIPATARRSNPFRKGMVYGAGPRCEIVKLYDIVMWPTQKGDFADGMYGYELMSLHEKDIVLILENLGKPQAP